MTAGSSPGRLERLVDWLENPILVKELRGAFRRRRYLYLLTGLLALAALAVLVTVSVLSGSESDPSAAGRRAFLVFFIAELLLVVMVFPAFSCTAIVEERLGKSFDLLVTTRLKARQITWGKFLASVVYGLTFIFATAPLVAIAFLFGGVTPGQIVAAYAALIGLCLVVSAYGLMVSSTATSPARSVIKTFSFLPLVIGFVLGPLVSLVTVTMIRPLLKDDFSKFISLGSSVLRSLVEPLLHTEGKPIAQVMEGLHPVDTALVWSGSVGWAAVWLLLFFIVASNRIKPPLADRATPLRVWFAGAWAGWLVLFSAFLLSTPPLDGAAAAHTLHRFYLVGLIGLTLGAVAFAVDDAEQAGPRALRTAAWWRRLLGGGAARGAVFIQLMALVGFVVLALSLTVVGVTSLPSVSGWEPPRTILMWGAAWILTFIFAVSQLGVTLARIAHHGLIARVWLCFLLAVFTVYPMFWFYLDDTRAKGNFYKGYLLSPWTVAWSAYKQPDPYARQLVLFGPSGAEITAAEQELSESFRREHQGRALRSGLARRLHERKQALRERMQSEGVAVHKASTGCYLLLGLLLLGLNLRAGRGKTLALREEPEEQLASESAGEEGSLGRGSGTEQRDTGQSDSGRASPEPEGGNLGAEPPGNHTEPEPPSPEEAASE